MTEPTDEEITRVLARLAGFYDDSPDLWAWCEKTRGLLCIADEPQVAFVPLKDWRDLGPLIEKCHVDLFSAPVGWVAKIHYTDLAATAATPMRAACLALYAYAEEKE